MNEEKMAMYEGGNFQQKCIEKAKSRFSQYGAIHTLYFTSNYEWFTSHESALEYINRSGLIDRDVYKLTREELKIPVEAATELLSLACSKEQIEAQAERNFSKKDCFSQDDVTYMQGANSGYISGFIDGQDEQRKLDTSKVMSIAIKYARWLESGASKENNRTSFGKFITSL